MSKCAEVTRTWKRPTTLSPNASRRSSLTGPAMVWTEPQVKAYQTYQSQRPGHQKLRMPGTDNVRIGT
jgi:hypothetical protein